MKSSGKKILQTVNKNDQRMDDWECDLIRPSTTHSLTHSIRPSLNGTIVHAYYTSLVFFVCASNWFALHCIAMQKKATLNETIDCRLLTVNCLFAAFIGFAITMNTIYILYIPFDISLLLTICSFVTSLEIQQWTIIKTNHLLLYTYSMIFEPKKNNNLYDRYRKYLDNFTHYFHTLICTATLRFEQLKWSIK